MNDQGMSSQTQSTTQKKKSKVGMKNVKSHPKQSNLNGNLNF